MNRVRRDWTFLRGGIGVFAICALVSGVMLAASFYFRDEMNSSYHRSQVRFRDASRRYLSVDEEERIIREHYPQFVGLYNKGILGHENRLNWLETLRDAGETIKMPDLHYQIGSQAPYSPPYAINTGGYRIFTSTMKLEMGLLHEYDFSDLLDELNRKASGLYSVSKCSFSRGEKEIKPDASRKNIIAGCELLWFTVNLPGEGLVLK